MEPRVAARMMSAGRVVIGATLIAAPHPVTRTWIGRRSQTPAARLLARALGARDLGIGLGVLFADRGRAPLRPWLLAGMLADGVDLVATLAERDRMPATAVPLIVAAAGGGIALGAYGLTA